MDTRALIVGGKAIEPPLQPSILLDRNHASIR